MKYVFSSNITDDKHNERRDGEIFITQRIDSVQEEALDDAELMSMDAENKAFIGCLPSIIELICMFATLCCAAAIIRNLGEISLAQMYSNAPWAFYVLAVAAPAWLVLWIIEKRRKKQVKDSGVEARAELNYNNVKAQSYEILGVPADAVTLDVMRSQYKIKNGEVKHTSPVNTFENAEYKVFFNGGDLCFADIHDRFDIPMEAARLVKVKASSVTLDEWHKAEKPKKEHYKLDPTNKSNSSLRLRYYGELRFNYMGTDYAVLFPPHELTEVEKLTGLTLTE